MKKIKLTRGQFAKVDDEDFELLNQFKWMANPHHSGRFVARGWLKGQNKLVYMHRLLMQAKRGQQVDHINGDALDNRRSNLRIANQSQNQWNRTKYKTNTSGYKGVYFCARYKKPRAWTAVIQKDNRQKSFKYFNNKISAALAYDMAAYQLHGEFARTNFGVRNGLFNLLPRD